ncbi:hypothetical protein D3C85_13660 [compost metagenome]
MTISKFYSSSRIVFVFWLLVSLGSCSITHYVNNSSFIYSPVFDIAAMTGTCTEFKRTVHLGHKHPVFPTVDVRRLTEEERIDLLLTYTERLRTYLRNDERYMAEDMARHKGTCLRTSQVFQK